MKQMINRKYTVKTFCFLSLVLSLGVLSSSPVYAVGGITTDKAPPHFATNENREDIEDLQVSVLGGVIRIDRRWNGEEWEWNKRWEDIGEEPDKSIIEAKLEPKEPGDITFSSGSGGGGAGGKLNAFANPFLFRNGQAYRRAPSDESGSLYENQLSKTITEKDNGYVWKDREGNRINYNKNGQMTSYVDPNGVTVTLVRDANGYIEAVKDHHDNVAVDYQWEDVPGATQIKNVNGDLYTPRRLVSLTDYSGRQVIYHWDINNRLVKITDVLGYEWQYTYSATGELTSQIDPEGRIVKYGISKKGRVAYRTDDNGSGDTYSYRYDNDKKEYYLSSTDQTGKVVESWYDKRGVEIRRLINGDLQFTADVVSSDGNKGVETIEKRYRTSGGSSGGGGGGKMAAFDLFDKPVYVKSKILTDVRGNKTRYEYDQWGNILKLTHPDGAAVSATWHTKFELPLSETNEKGITTSYEYDDKGNLLTLTEAKGTIEQRITRYTYDQYGQVKTITTGESTANNAALATTSIDYDDYGNITKITDPEGNITLFREYDALGNAKKIIDSRASVLAEGQQYAWVNTYDAAGNLLSGLNPDGVGDIYTYTQSGMLKTITGADGNSIRVTSNAIGLPLTLTDANDKVTELQYDKENRLTQVIDANNNKFQLVYDKHGRYERIIDGEEQTTQFTYVDNLLRSIQFPTYKEIVDYDNRNRANQTTQQANNRNYLRKRGYDLASNLTQSIDANNKPTSYEYDALNRTKKIIDASNGITEFTYDARDNLLQVKDPEGRVTLFTYDKNDQLLTETKDGDQATNKQRHYDYDKNGNLVTSINQEQEKTVHEYDRSNRLIKTSVYAHKDHTQPIKVINYSINNKDQMTGWSQSVSSGVPEGVASTADVIALSETFAYNNLGQLESVIAHFGSFSKTFSYTYYPNGQRKTYTNAEGITYTYYYNKNNQLMAVHIPGSGQISYAAFQWMMPQTIVMPGGQTVTLSYNDFQQVKERMLKNSSDQTLATALYEYDFENNIQKITKGEGVFNYNYDNLYRLTTADSPEGHAANDESFNYDGVGNRLTRTENTATDTQTYNAKNQLQTISTVTGEEAAIQTAYTYNANGHTKTQTKNGVTTEYIYNHEERLIAVKRDGQMLAEYVYNPRGQRVRKTANGETTWYLYNRNGLAAEYSSTGQLIKEYHFHPQKPWMTDPQFMRTATGSYYYYHNDHLGTPQQLVDTAGQVVWEAQYTAFGKATITATTIKNNLRFPGQYYDEETQLHHNYMRDYDPSTGRYLQQDFVGLIGGLNNYSYVYGNPIGLFDPLGLWAWGDPLPQWMVDGAAGFGDSLSFGLTAKVRDMAGINGGVDKCSDAYGFGEAGAAAMSLAFGAGTIGRHAFANGGKSIFAENRTFNTVSRRWHNAFPNSKVDLDHMFISRELAKKLGIGKVNNSGINLVPLSPSVNRLWLNPKNLFWLKKHPILGKFVPQILRGLAQTGTAGLYGAIPTVAANQCSCQK